MTQFLFYASIFHPSLALIKQKQKSKPFSSVGSWMPSIWENELHDAKKKNQSRKQVLFSPSFLFTPEKWSSFPTPHPTPRPGYPWIPLWQPGAPRAGFHSCVNLVGSHAWSFLCLWTVSLGQVFHSPVPSAPKGSGFAARLIMKSRAWGRSGMEEENSSVSHHPQVPSTASTHKAALLAHGKQIWVVFGPRLGGLI